MATLGDVFYRKQQSYVGVSFVEYLTGVEEHYTPSDRWKFVLDLVGLDSSVFRDYVFQKIPQRRDVPLAIAQLVEQSALGFLRLHPKDPVKGPARGHYPQVSVKHDEGLADGVNGRLRKSLPVLNVAQVVMIRHGDAFSPKVRDVTIRLLVRPVIVVFVAVGSRGRCCISRTGIETRH